MKYVHTNIIARDWKKLSKFYQDVFQCVPIPPERDLRGEWVDALTGIKNAHIQGEHLLLPGHGEKGPTLEIFSYNDLSENEKCINTPGFAHIAFLTDNVETALEAVKKNGGTTIGEIVIKKYPNSATGTFVYCRDIEGNIIELQKWDTF
ncbi:MAG: VOC family protein [Treponema sp.]|nr:VOC family protein [Treponema sp.]